MQAKVIESLKNMNGNGMSNGSQMRFTQAELELVKATFKGNEAVLQLLRKIFLPELDPAAPIGQMIDLWMTIDVRQLMPEQAYVRLLARNELISHVDNQLLQLSVLANMEEPAAGAVAEARGKNSTK